MTSKILYSIDEVAAITKLPPLLIGQYLRLKKRALNPELFPDINPRYIKGEPFFTRKDINALLRYIDKRNGESWDTWQLRMAKETIAKKEAEKKQKQPQRPELKIVHHEEKEDKEKE